MDEYTKFVNQKLEDSDFLKYSAGIITKHNIVGYPQKGAEKTFSIGQPMFDAEGRLLGYLGIGLFDSLDYSNDKGIRIPVECWVIELPTRHCEVGKNVFTYWQNEQRKAEIEEVR